MAQFRQIIFDYLEHVEPERYQALARQRILIPTVFSLAAAMTEESRRLSQELSKAHPAMSAIEASIQAEAIVIAEFLPTVGDAANNIANTPRAGKA